MNDYKLTIRCVALIVCGNQRRCANKTCIYTQVVGGKSSLGIVRHVVGGRSAGLRKRYGS